MNPLTPPAPLGLHPRWQSDAALLKRKQKTPVNSAVAQALRDRRAAMQAYARGDNPFGDTLDPMQSLRGPMHWKVRLTLAWDPEALTNAEPLVDGLDAWLPDFARGLWCHYWRWQIEWQLQCLPKANGPVWLHEVADLLAKCLYAGWMTEARVVAGAIRQMYSERKLTNTEGKESQPLAHFLLRLAFDHFALPFADWGRGRQPKLDVKNPLKKGQCLGEPVLNELYDHWREPDLTPWMAHLQWLCDYGTHRVKSNMEYAYNPYGARFVGVVLPWMRLREAHDLGMPRIDHPVLAAPYDHLPAPLPKPEDPLLEAVLDRLVREELPNLRAAGQGTWTSADAG
ncbi:MAG: hypothetical protein MUE46_00185 [Xanthomonadales bacterium]|jgi:hypothetical protein|nr:hypothetical protein [Xanthomonadales bacterium]